MDRQEVLPLAMIEAAAKWSRFAALLVMGTTLWLTAPTRSVAQERMAPGGAVEFEPDDEDEDEVLSPAEQGRLVGLTRLNQELSEEKRRSLPTDGSGVRDCAGQLAERAWIHWELGNLSAAGDDVNEALQLVPRQPVAVQKDTPAAALPLLEAAERHLPGDRHLAIPWIEWHLRRGIPHRRTPSWSNWSRGSGRIGWRCWTGLPETCGPGWRPARRRQRRRGMPWVRRTQIFDKSVIDLGVSPGRGGIAEPQLGLRRPSARAEAPRVTTVCGAIQSSV